MDESFIVVSIISGIFGILGLELISHNWFKKERFKFEVFNLKKRQDLELKKMARDMGLDIHSSKTSRNSGEGGAGLGDLIKGLNPDTLAALADVFQGRIGGGEGEGSIIPEGLEGLADFAAKNPDLVKSFISGLTKNQGGGGSEGFM